MKDIKFRYVIKYSGDQIKMFVLTLDDIQKRCGTWDEINKFLDSVGLVNYQIIARDLYTGLKDKNVKEIYEGDIVKFDNTAQILSLEIQFSPIEGYRPCMKGIGGFKWYPAISEVIGNIYENPELLK